MTSQHTYCVCDLCTVVFAAGHRQLSGQDDASSSMQVVPMLESSVVHFAVLVKSAGQFDTPSALLSTLPMIMMLLGLWAVLFFATLITENMSLGRVDMTHFQKYADFATNQKKNARDLDHSQTSDISRRLHVSVC